MRVVGYINLVVQFFFIRICVAIDRDTNELKELAILCFPFPLTGWFSNYRSIGKLRYYKTRFKAPKWLTKELL